jgi:hypothetical protein
VCAPSPVKAATSRLVPARPLTIRKSSCRPIKAGTASRRSEHPLALFFDDLQWLDAATLDLLEHLLTRGLAQH